MKIKVEQRHIDKGARKCIDGCMVALAIGEVVPNSTVYVHLCGAYIDGERYDLPRHVAAAIDQFDDGLPVEPFEFEIEIELENTE